MLFMTVCVSCVDRKITAEHSYRVGGTYKASNTPFPVRASEEGRVELDLGRCFVSHSFFQSTIFLHPPLGEASWCGREGVSSKVWLPWICILTSPTSWLCDHGQVASPL